jgi:hypothetical protein
MEIVCYKAKCLFLAKKQIITKVRFRKILYLMRKFYSALGNKGWCKFLSISNLEELNLEDK